MKISFPDEVSKINDTDFDILRVLEEHGALWKMEITRKINNGRNNDTLLDVKDSISKQAVSKRVERLFELGYIDTSIISFKKADGPNNSSLIRGYKLNDKGRLLLRKTVKLILRDVVSERIIRGDKLFDTTGLNLYFELYNELNNSSIDGLTDFAVKELKRD